MYSLKTNILPTELCPASLLTLHEAVPDLTTYFLWVHSDSPCLWWPLAVFLPLPSTTGWVLTPRPLIHLGYFCTRERTQLQFLYVDMQFCWCHLFWSWLSPKCGFQYLRQNSGGYRSMILYLDTLSASTECVSVLMPHWFCCFGFAVELEEDVAIPPSGFLLSCDFFYLYGLWCLHVQFRICFSISEKNGIGILMRTLLNGWNLLVFLALSTKRIRWKITGMIILTLL